LTLCRQKSGRLEQENSMPGKATDTTPAANQNEDRSGPNEGEGNQTGARRYDAETRAFVAGGKVKKAAAEAVRDIGGPEAGELKRAEAEGKKHSHGEDPLLRR
jgi:hypothetical protein